MNVPAGVPSLLTLGQTARVLNLEERTLKGWLDRGTLPYFQPSGPHGKRLISPTTLAGFAARNGLTLDWEKAL